MLRPLMTMAIIAVLGCDQTEGSYDSTSASGMPPAASSGGGGSTASVELDATPESIIHETEQGGGRDAIVDGGAVSGDSETGAMTLFQVTVTNGFGSGTYEEGSTVHIWSDHDPRTQVVANWSGDSEILRDRGEWHTSFVMPSRNVTFTAELIDTTFNLVEEQFSGRDRTKTVRYFIPSTPLGLVHFTHGTGGSGAMIEGIETGYIARVLVEAGYGVWATDAEEVDIGDQDGNGKIRWKVSPVADNVDLVNLNRIFEQFINRGIIPQGTPRFMVGMSNGGAFSLSAGRALNLNAAVVYCASGSDQVAAVTETPTAWFLCELDDHDQVDNNKAIRNHEALVSRGIATQLEIHGPSPLYDQRFARIVGLDEAMSKAIADELRLNNHVDAQGFLLQDGSDISISVRNLPSAHPVVTGLQRQSEALEVLHQLRIMRANHRIYDDYARRTLAFIQAHTP